MPDNDPRIFFASERTLLAWVRTGIAIIALGFVVSRFGLFLRLLGSRDGSDIESRASLSGMLGIAFVLLGAFAVIAASLQHHRYISTLLSQDWPQAYSRNFAIRLALAIGLLGILLAAYLFVA